MEMTPNIVKAISVIGGALFAVTGVNLIYLIMGGSGDSSLQATFIALIAAGSSLDFYIRLERRYLQKPASD